MGAKRKAGPREADGRVKRTRTKDALDAINAARSQAVKATVLAQPHRRGNDDPRLSDAVGRFCARHKLRPEVYDAACAYQGMVRRHRILRGAPMLASPHVEAKDDDPRDAAERTIVGPAKEGELSDLARRILLCDKAMADESFPGFLALRGAICDEAEVLDADADAATRAGMALAYHLGRHDGADWRAWRAALEKAA